MKELSIEEKARNYDEAIERAKSYQGLRSEMEIIFPELKESEGVRIRNALVEFVHDTTGDSLWVDYGVHKEEALAWLEKQGEQNPANSCKTCKDEQKPAWSEENEKFFLTALWHISYSISNCKSTDIHCPTTDWLKSLKERVQLQPKQEWSEEEEAVLDALIRRFKGEDIYVSPNSAVECLKSIKDRYAWKPSDEQMHYLSWIANIKLGDSVVEQEVSKHLNELLEDLKKLREA